MDILRFHFWLQLPRYVYNIRIDTEHNPKIYQVATTYAENVIQNNKTSWYIF